MLLLLFTACDGSSNHDDLAISIPFRATVGGEPFACGTTYDGVGTSAATIDPLDLRFYVYDVALVDAAGATTPLALTQDGRWQYQDVALIDLEDGSGSCATGSPDTNAAIVGTAPEGEYAGVSFRVGVPPALNHLDAATAPAPLNDTGLWWAWTSGFKFARIDMATAANPAFYFHLGATDCALSESGDYACALDNNPPVTLDLNPDREGAEVVAIDLLDFYADNDLEAPVDFVTDFVSGCMAFAGDPECTALFAKLGLPWGDDVAAPEQTFFQVEAR